MAKLTPEQQIRANVQAALGKQQTKQPVKKQNVFVSECLKSTSKTRSTDLAEIIEICEGLPVSDPTAAALCLICCHNNSQIRQRIKAETGQDIGAITPEQISLATGEEFSALDFAAIIAELISCGVLSIDDDDYYHCVLYATE